MTDLTPPEKGKFNRDVFWQDEVWFDYFGRAHKIADMDREYAANILDYLQRKFFEFTIEGFWRTPLVRALTERAYYGRPERWTDRLRHRLYWWRRNRDER